MKPTLLLIGERALDLRERLEASGYDTVGWSGKDAVDSIGAGLIPRERVKAVLITRDEVAVVPLLQAAVLRCLAGSGGARSRALLHALSLHARSLHARWPEWL